MNPGSGERRRTPVLQRHSLTIRSAHRIDILSWPLAWLGLDGRIVWINPGDIVLATARRP